MTRTLAFKLILAFLFVSLTVAVLGTIIARWITVQEFNRLVLEQVQNRFIEDVTAYYQIKGSWAGVLEFLRQRASQTAPQLPAGKQDGPYPAFIFLLTDPKGVVVVPAKPYRLGERLSPAELAQATPVELNGQVVGYVLASGDPPKLNLREEHYLARTDLALLYAALASTVVALLLGVFLARSLTRPLRQMTVAIRAMAKGELEQRVEVRSQDEIGELGEAFNQMSAELARANQLRRQMTADIAHDLRTPLTVIGGYVEALRDQVLRPSPERFETIYTEVQHLQRLVEDLRTLSLADAGELPLNRGPAAPRALLDRLAAAYAQRAEEKGIYLQAQAEADLPEIDVDEQRMAQVLGNLIDNALRHTPAGGQIILSAEARATAIQLRVRDTGEGIPPAALAHVFDRFYRVDASRQCQGGESGLGLAIARSIVEAHGGRIEVESELGRGTLFTITL
jgi:signal transduction histidine kinase